MTTKKIIIGICVLILVALAAYFATAARNEPPALPIQEDQPHVYENDHLDLRLTYPEGFVLRDDGEHEEHVVTLLPTAEAAPREGSEEPAGITLAWFHDEEDRPIADWVRASDESNFKLGDGTLTTTTVDGKEAVTYRWSGLYEGETTAFVQAGHVVTFSVTRITPEDPQVAVYRNILGSLELK